MTISTTVHAAALNAATTVDLLLAQGPSDGPVGPEFGKASPIGLFILVVLGVAVLALGWAFYRRFTRFRRRAMFAEAHGIDLFDEAAVDKAMEEAGVFDRRRKPFL
ncbi:hypothetical protein [Corynebacterium guangdongense]|uniref:LPXTG-motif cell wall anchor domain-containing protein n=1 Tax=Corynebacterium guangdongense TaxID=1783348 RepID=A0ABU1ZVG5_9CORY|nr:hypothetical protein [Corynebacterium guangdongense]MDR7328919.1 hypothetical protein [Corynebacterium guangdongense]WJZ17494.1 hypothetical protein CGUA_04530 [Corynebacterium guangdongense]